MVHQEWELIGKIERENRLQSRPTLPILVVIGWAGNDVSWRLWVPRMHMDPLLQHESP